MMGLKNEIKNYNMGEYVAPEKIENIYSRSTYIQQVYVDCDSFETFLIAIVVPEPSHLQAWYKSKIRKDKDLETFCELDQAKEAVLLDLQRLGKEAKLNGIEQVKAIVLESNPFTIENGLLTPTLKSKRPQIREKYLSVMKETYKIVK